MKSAALAFCLAFLTACSQPHRLTVGSKNFTEQLVLGEIVAQHLERELHMEVRRKLDLGGTFLAQQAILTGAIDLYPEYTGTALSSVLKQPIVKDPKTAMDCVRAGYARWNLQWMNSLGFENTFAMAVRREDAQARHIHTLSDAARYQPGWRMGVGYEFESRPDGLPGLLKTYNLKQSGSIRTMDLGLLYKALAQKQVDLIAGNSTDGALSVLPIDILADDRHFFPPYEAAIVVRSSALSQYAGLEAALRKLEGRFTTDLMRKLNYEVDGRHRPVREVAAHALKNLPQ
jgi:glycine betaine/choline ABC-type transport system substrate-binding protein